MSLNFSYYQKLEPGTAFLAGVADTALSTILLPLFEDNILETDIFSLNGDELSSLYDELLLRFQSYNQIEGYSLDLEKDPFMPELPLIKISDTNIIDALTKEFYQNYTQVSGLRNRTSDFYYTLCSHLNPARALWKLDLDLVQEYMPSLEEALALFYMYDISNIYLLQFHNYAVMIIIGK